MTDDKKGRADHAGQRCGQPREARDLAL